MLPIRSSNVLVTRVFPGTSMASPKTQITRHLAVKPGSRPDLSAIDPRATPGVRDKAKAAQEREAARTAAATAGGRSREPAVCAAEVDERQAVRCPRDDPRRVDLEGRGAQGPLSRVSRPDAVEGLKKLSKNREVLRRVVDDQDRLFRAGLGMWVLGGVDAHCRASQEGRAATEATDWRAVRGRVARIGSTRNG